MSPHYHLSLAIEKKDLMGSGDSGDSPHGVIWIELYVYVWLCGGLGGWANTPTFPPLPPPTHAGGRKYA